MAEQPPVVAVITGTRAEFGLLLPVIRGLMRDETLDFRLLVTGSHLCRALGYTLDEITAAGIPVARTFDILNDDPKTPVATAIARAIEQFAAYWNENPTDMAVVLGDRYEIFGAVTAAAVCDVPVAHISGGETTEGAKDEFFRHSITKMSALHFAAAEVYRNRIVQLGEQPETVFNAGALGAENIMTMTPLRREELSEQIGFDVAQPYILCTVHPETLGGGDTMLLLENLLRAFDDLKLRVLFTAANADEGGAAINRRIEEYCTGNTRCMFVASLGVLRYLSAMRYCTAVAGNSSSAIVEAPTLRKPAVNIGDRQRGRRMSDGVLNCDSSYPAIVGALQKAVSAGFVAAVTEMESPFGGGDASSVIVREIKNALQKGVVKNKKFFDIR